MNRIKIAYFIGSLGYGGAETQLLELLRNLDRTRIEPSLILLDCAARGRAENLVDGICDLRVPQRATKGRSMIDIQRTAAAVFRLAAHLIRTKPAIVQAILPEAHAVAAAAIAIARRTKLIGSRRSMAAAYRRSASIALVDRIATRRSDVMIGNSNAVAQELVKTDGVPASRVVRIYNGVNTKRFRPGDRQVRQSAGWTDQNIVFGMLANFRSCKRHIDFVAAAEIIARENSDARFVLVGRDCDGTLEPLKSEIRARGLERLFTIFPLATNPEKLYPSMDAFLCTSETEGFSNVLLEAAASCLPIVATTVGGNPEIVKEGFNGMLVEPKRPDSLAAAALRLAASPTLREDMGRRSRQWISSEFSIEAMVNAHMVLYEGLVSPLHCDASQTAISERVRAQ